MCLILTVRLAEPDAARVPEICRAVGLHPSASEAWRYGAARRNSGVIWIPGPEGGCGCSFLADTADRDAPTWDMVPSSLPRLAAVLRTLRQQTSAGFHFDALWAGESASEERRISVDDLVQFVEQSKLGTRTRYFVE